MQINSVSATPPSATATARSTTASPAKATAAAAPSTTSTPAPAAAASANATPPAATQALASAAASLVNTVYSTTVAGKSYSGSIEQSAGQYEISIPNLPGASASGSSVQAAENALTVKIDTLA
jgi:hypothetical protein